MASTIASLIAIARSHLNEEAEVTDGAWTDAQLAALANLAVHDLWRAINDNFQNYFLTIDTTNVYQAASGVVLTGVPADVGIVRGLEPLVPRSYPGLIYVARDYNGIDFARARALSSQDPSSGGQICYALRGAGAPVGAPSIDVAPAVSARVNLRLTYVPTLAAVTALGTNPIPGESDNAIVAWMVAYASAKQNDDQTPNAGWLALYGTEKQNMLVSLTPRQTEDDEYAEAMFQDEWQA
jgi:hypothetical protein